MNYITSCPACGTQFLLNNQHLKSHRGKVQCGNCEHIFNAKNRLTEVSDDIHSPEEYNASLESTTESDEKRIGDALNIVLEGVPDLQDLESGSSESESLAAYPITISQADTGPYISENTPDVTELYATDQISSPISIEDLVSNDKFSKRKTKLNYWLVSHSVLLAVLAGLQTIYAKRTQIAAEHPQYKPYLIQACKTLKCEIPLPTNLDLLTVDDSDMQEDENHQYVVKFSSLLINNAHFAQAYPNIELTLTSTDDQAVLRKLIKPVEYLKTGTNVATGIGSREEMRIQLAIDVKDLAVAGYRILLVY